MDTASCSDWLQASNSIRLNGLSASCRVTGVASSENRVGWIGRRVVNSCRARSAAQISPPGLARRSTMSPVCGSSPSSLISSATNASSSLTSNDQIRR